MFSARKLLAVTLASLVVAGCAERIDGSRTQRLSPAPILQDDAMNHRQWDLSSAYYANGSSVAYPTLYPYAPRQDAPELETLVMAPALFAGQTLLLPFTALTEPAWEPTTNTGVYTPPTYTAVPEVQADGVGYAGLRQWTKVSRPTPRPGREEDRKIIRD